MIIAIDPGGTTGIAYFDEDVGFYTDALKAHAIPAYIKSILEEGKTKTLIVERFLTSGLLSRFGLETIDLVGQLRGLCLAYNVECVLHQPQARKPFELHTPAMTLPGQLKRRTIHENDALAHLLVYIHSHNKEAIFRFIPDARKK